MKFLKKTIVFFYRADGQLLVEMLVALVIGGLLTLTASVALVSLVRYNFENQGNQNSSALAYNLMSAVSSFAERGWHNIYDLSKTSASHYYLVSAPTSSLAVAGSESVFFNDVEAGLVGYWKFDESTGTIAYDSSGNAMQGASYGGVTRVASASCAAGACLAFDGKTGYVSATNTTPLSALSAFTWSAWIYPTAANAITDIMDNGSSCVLQYSDKQNVLFSISSGGPVHLVTSNGMAPLNTWSHVVATFDGSNMEIYINGAQDTATGTGGVPTPTTTPFYIGAGPSAVNPFSGNIDDVRIYNRALSASEISLLYNNKPYTRYFYVDNVLRDGSGNIVTSTGTDDPSTQMVHSVVLWEENRAVTLGQYVTRSKETALYQNNWRSGSGQTGPITNVLTGYDTSSYLIAGTTLTLSATTTAGSLTSSIFDTQAVGGATINSLLWQGTLNGGSAQFQFAYANSPSGPWTFYGPGASPSTYYTPTNSGIPLAITDINNYRYFRYEIFLARSSAAPVISSISIGWSP